MGVAGGTSREISARVSWTGPEEGLEWKLSECPGHPERHLPECGVKSPNRVIVVNRNIIQRKIKAS